MYKKAVASFWSVEEVDLSQDARDWERLTGSVSTVIPLPPPPAISMSTLIELTGMLTG